MKNINVMFSKNTDDWKTPTKIYEHFVKNLNCIDPFPFQSKEDNMQRCYLAKGERERDIFINPPFSKLKEIPQFIKNNLYYDRYIYLLIPARTDTKYFIKFLEYQPIIYFIKGRLKYNDTGTAPFPTILLIFHNLNLFPIYETITQEELLNYDPKKL